MEKEEDNSPAHTHCLFLLEVVVTLKKSMATVDYGKKSPIAAVQAKNQNEPPLPKEKQQHLFFELFAVLFFQIRITLTW